MKQLKKTQMRKKITFLVLTVLFLLIAGNIAGQPTAKAPTPPVRSAGTYYSIYSHAPNYGVNLKSDSWSNNGGATNSAITQYGDEYREINLTYSGGTSYVTINLSPTPVNVTQYDYLCFDVWVQSVSGTGALSMRAYPDGGLSGNVNYEYKINSDLVSTGWNTIKIPVTNSTAFSQLGHFRFLKYTNGAAKIYVDNIYFYKEDPNVPKNESLPPPPLSTIWGADKVTSIFSNAYTSTGTITSFTPSKIDFNIDDNKNYAVWRFDNTASVLMKGNINVSGKNRFHVDVWTKEAKSFQLKMNGSLVYPQANRMGRSGTSYNTEGEKWLSIDVELPNGTNTISSIEITGDNTTYFLDNIYSYSDNVSVPEINIWDANKALGRGMNLGNAFEEQGYNTSGNTFNVDIAKELIDKIASLNTLYPGNKFDHIRIPVRWDLWGKKDDGSNITGGRPYRTDINYPYAIDPEFMGDVKTVVDYVLSKNMKVVLNIHHYNTLYADFDAQKPRFLAMWRQIADQFKFYDHNLYFEMLNEPRQPGSGNDRMTDDDWLALIPETLPIMRTGGANTTRPILVTSFDWGSFPRLERLELPADDHLIATVHLYNPTYICNQFDNGTAGINTNIEWWDTQIERNLVQTAFLVADRFQKRYPNVPLHVGEFGSYKRTETDSRSLWISYLRDAFEKRGYSHAYWEFRAGYGIYTYNSGTYNQPIVDALLSNDVPKTPAAHTFQAVGEPILDQNRDLTNNWTNINGGIGSHDIIKTFTTSIWGPGKTQIPLAQDGDKAYRFTFKASADKEGFGFMIATSANRTVSERTSTAKTSEYIFYPGKEAEEHSFIIYLRQNNAGATLSTTLISPPPGVSNSVTLTFTDFLIEEIEKRHEAAPTPTLAASEINNIYSSVYSGSKSLIFTGSGNQSYIKDNSTATGKNIIQIANFTNQKIAFAGVPTSGKNTLHLNLYAGSQMKGVTIKVNGTITKTVDLPSHTWQQIGVDLGSLTNVSSIELSGGTGEGRKLFLDHIYLQAGAVSGNVDKIPAAGIPEQLPEEVVPFYSSKYDINNSSLTYSNPASQTTIKDVNDKNVLQFNNLTTQAIGYEKDGDTYLELGDRNRFHMDFYPEQRFELSVKLIYDNGSSQLEEEVFSGYVIPGQWNSIDIPIEDFLTQTESKISQIQLIKKGDSGTQTLYVDHAYFYYEQIINENDPAFPAYLPPVINASGNLISVFSNYYDNLGTPEFSYRPATIKVQEDDIWRFKNINDFTLSFSTGIDISEMTHLHVDVWTNNAASFNLYLNEASNIVSQSTPQNGWLRLDIPLADFPNILSSLNAIGISSSSPLTYYIDNLYFYNNEESFTPSPIQEVNAGLVKGMNLDGFLNKEMTGVSADLLKLYVDKIIDLGNSENKFGHIRLPIDWTIGDRSMAQGPYNLNPGFVLDTVKPLVDYILNKGLNMIITLSGNEVVSAQIADYFQYYPESLLFEVENSTVLSVVRATNIGRSVLFSSMQNIPADEHLIASTIYQAEGLSVWQDTQTERDIVNEEITALGNVNVPVYVQSLGISSAADMDSRALWTTYVTRYLESRNYSWAYQNFTGTNGIYQDDKYQTPIVDALLVNPMPEAAQFGGGGGQQIYNSDNDNLEANWSFYDGSWSNLSEIDNENKKLTVTMYTSSSEEVVALINALNVYESGKRYQIRFKVQSSVEGLTYKACIGSYVDEYSYEVYYSKEFATDQTAGKEFIFSFDYEKAGAGQLFFLLGNTFENPETKLIFEDIIIEQIESATKILPALVPLYHSSEVTAIYSSKYSNANGINFPASGGKTTVSETTDSEGHSISLFSDFDTQSITFDEIESISKNNLHISAYPGSVLHLEVEAIYGSSSEVKTISLEPHKWNEIEINLTDFFSQTQGKINEIRFSGGTGVGRSLYLDHIYFYSVFEAAPVPPLSAESVLSVFSTKYGNLAGLQLNSVDLKYVIDTNDNNVPRVNDSGLEIVLGTGVESTELKKKSNMNLSIYPTESKKLVIDIYDSLLGRVYGLTIPASPVNQWTVLDIPLQDFLSQYTGTVSKIVVKTEDGMSSINYFDHIYFYSDPAPTSFPEDPSSRPEDVISFYGDSYQPLTDLVFQTDGSTKMSEYPIEVDGVIKNCIKLRSFGELVITRSNGALFDLSEMEFFYMNLWTVENNIKLELILDWGNESASMTKTITGADEWQTIQVALGSVGTFNLAKVKSVTIRNSSSAGLIYIDNAFFYKIPLTGVSVWTGAAGNNNWNDGGNWSVGKAPKSQTDVYIPGGLSSYPFLTGNKLDNVCRNIYFLQGGELGRQDLLTYQRAHIQLNYGLDAVSHPQLTETNPSILPYPSDPGTEGDQLSGIDLQNHLKFSAGNSTKVGGNQFSGDAAKNARDRWIMLTSPLKGMASGDVSFAGYPTVYMQQIEVRNGEAQWTNPFARTNIEMKPGVGFVLFVRHGDDYGVLGNRETRNEDGKLSGLSQVNGILELPYYQNTEMSAAHRIHEYENGISRFYYYSSGGFEVTERYEAFARRGEDNYRFTMEDESGNPIVSVPVYSASLKGGSEVLVGNPFMSTIDFDQLHNDNPHVGHYYRIWTGSGYNTYLNNGSGSYGTGDLTKYIAPMQSFLVSTLNDSEEVIMNYNIENISLKSNNYPGLKSLTTPTNQLHIKAINDHSSSEALVVIKDNFSDSYYPQEDVYKLFTNISNVPEVYTWMDNTAIEINCIASDKIDIPVGLKTNLLGETKFILSGMDELNSSVYLIDRLSDKVIDITGEPEYEYSFDNRIQGVQNDRFIIRLAENIDTGLNEVEDELYIRAWQEESYIQILSSTSDPIEGIVLYDMQGKVIVKEDNIHASEHQIAIKIETGQPYILKVITKKGVKNLKIQK